jgi:hypothetical protein
MNYWRGLDAKSTSTFVDWPMVEPKPMMYPEVQGAPPMLIAEERVEYTVRENEKF